MSINRLILSNFYLGDPPCISYSSHMTDRLKVRINHTTSPYVYGRTFNNPFSPLFDRNKLYLLPVRGIFPMGDASLTTWVTHFDIPTCHSTHTQTVVQTNSSATVAAMRHGRDSMRISEISWTWNLHFHVAAFVVVVVPVVFFLSMWKFDAFILPKAGWYYRPVEIFQLSDSLFLNPNKLEKCVILYMHICSRSTVKSAPISRFNTPVSVPCFYLLPVFVPRFSFTRCLKQKVIFCYPWFRFFSSSPTNMVYSKRDTNRKK